MTRTKISKTKLSSVESACRQVSSRRPIRNPSNSELLVSASREAVDTMRKATERFPGDMLETITLPTHGHRIPFTRVTTAIDRRITKTFLVNETTIIVAQIVMLWKASKFRALKTSPIGPARIKPVASMAYESVMANEVVFLVHSILSSASKAARSGAQK
eukprot:CAMPEP_0172766044 /NCGR_PEP_ID=MMETSP1074-20121228/180464_1 /TAXON_ID=2916 /ORGANISM="Ceratium fusus, Strain PA161109" /LENGTH=159 /DNA_ID=CAMNT_0013601089 /DNA_START=648 /DNA_END=1127 /DNA_ORIENTATION=-